MKERTATCDELEAGLRRSRRALPGQAFAALLLLVAICAVRLLFRVPTWVAVVVAFFAVFGVAGDALNILFCRRALRRLDIAERNE